MTCWVSIYIALLPCCTVCLLTGALGSRYSFGIAKYRLHLRYRFTLVARAGCVLRQCSESCKTLRRELGEHAIHSVNDSRGFSSSVASVLFSQSTHERLEQTKSGAYVYKCDASSFHEWEFRTPKSFRIHAFNSACILNSQYIN